MLNDNYGNMYETGQWGIGGSSIKRGSINVNLI